MATVDPRLLALLAFAVAGALYYLARERRLRRRQVELERIVAVRTAEIEAANARLAQLAREDALTGVANRRVLDDALAEEWRRAVRLGAPLALLLVDVDLLRAFNERQGHRAGDDCLRAIAAAVSEVCRRAGELVARYGGAQFAVLLPGVARRDAFAAAEKVRRCVEALQIAHPASTVAPVVTLSVGVAWTEPGASGAPAVLLHTADRALHRAKQSGRNRVEGGELE